ncbi:hypothetical protein AMTRI_Chr12g241650 [Amborella trichopoda]
MGSNKRQSDKFKRVCGENSEMHALGRKFQTAVSFHNWESAERLIPLADMARLNDAVCIPLDSIWFFSTESELHGIIGLIRTFISNGANDFTRAALRPSFLASCVPAWRSLTISTSIPR